MQPFAGLEVVEFGQFIAVPFCAQLLAEGGAHVIKVESLEGDPVRNLAPLAPGETRHFISRNRGKHTLPLDLRHPGARPVIDRLVARADVVLTNFRPGLAEEIGLDYASLAPRHPRWAERGAWLDDITAAARPVRRAPARSGRSPPRPPLASPDEDDGCRRAR